MSPGCPWQPCSEAPTLVQGGDLCLDSVMSPNTLVRGPNPPRPQKGMHLEIGLLRGDGGNIQSQRGLEHPPNVERRRLGHAGRASRAHPQRKGHVGTGRRRLSAGQSEASGDTPPAGSPPPGRRGNKSVLVSSYVGPGAHPPPMFLKPALAPYPPSAPRERTLPCPALGLTLNQASLWPWPALQGQGYP